MQLDGKGNGKSYNLMKQFDNIMRTTFGEKIELVSYYGPVQMCVFGLEYKYLPLSYTIKAECARGENVSTKYDISAGKVLSFCRCCK